MNGKTWSHGILSSLSILSAVLLSLSCAEEPKLSFKPVWVREGIAFQDDAGRILKVSLGASGRVPDTSVVRLAKAGLTMVAYRWKPGESIEANILYRIPTSRKRDQSFFAKFNAPQKPTPLSIARLDLESTLSLISKGASPSTPTSVEVDLAGTRAAVSSSGGAVAVYSLPDAEAIWHHNAADGYIKAMAFSEDGKTLYIGDQSRDGGLFAADLDKESETFGEIAWRYSLAEDLGSEGTAELVGDAYEWVKLPGVFRIQALANGDVLMLGCHSWEAEDGGRQLSRLYRLAPDGKLRWAWPEDGVLPLLANWVDASEDGTVIAVCAEERFGGAVNPKGEYEPGTVFVLDGDGRPLAQTTIEPNKEYFDDVYFWRGLDLRPDGLALCVTTIDGRAFHYDLSGAKRRSGQPPITLGPSWKNDIAAPFDVGGVPVLATLGTVGATQAWSLIVSGGSYVVPGVRTGSGEPPGLHPNGLTIFGAAWDGSIAWQHRLQAATQGMAVSNNGRYAAAALSSSAPAKSPNAFHGVSLFDLEAEGPGPQRLLYTYPIEGAVPYGGASQSPAAASSWRCWRRR